MNISAVNNVKFQSKFITRKPLASNVRIFDGQELLAKIPETYKNLEVILSGKVDGMKNGIITEKLVFNYGKPEKKCSIARDVVNQTTDGAKVGYKKTTKLSGQKPGFQLLIQNLKDGVYFSQSNVHKPFVFDFKLDKLPKSVVGNDKNNQKTHYTKQPSFFKNLYLKFLNRLITDKNGCEKTNSKIFNRVAQMIDENIEKEPFRSKGYLSVEWRSKNKSELYKGLNKKGMFFQF